jgi:hypothetical protein
VTAGFEVFLKIQIGGKPTASVPGATDDFASRAVPVGKLSRPRSDAPWNKS